MLVMPRAAISALAASPRHGRERAAVPLPGSGGRHERHVMSWVVWPAIAAFVLGLLTVSRWYDRDACKRGVTPLSGKEMSRARRANERALTGEMSQVISRGMTPKSQDALRDAWRGTTGSR
jgi:hypothetical protein